VEEAKIESENVINIAKSEEEKIEIMEKIKKQ